MDFYEYNHLFAAQKTLGFDVKSPAIFYASFCRDLLQQIKTGPVRPISVYNQAVSEILWFEHHNPYYKIYPDIIPLLSRVSIDIPSQYLQLPFPAFCIRFPKENNPFVIDKDHRVQSVLVTERKADDVIYTHDQRLPNETRRLYLWFDINECEEDDVATVMTYKQAVLCDNESIEDCFSRLHREPSMAEGVQIPDVILDDCTRLCMSICFLATNADRCIEFDVIKRLKERYQKGSSEERKRIEDKSKRLRKYGWNVGDIHLPRSETASSFSAPTGKHLSYQHLRSGHFHLVWTGPGKTIPKVKFYSPITVRPDLPLPPKQHGYSV